MIRNETDKVEYIRERKITPVHELTKSDGQRACGTEPNRNAGTESAR